MNRYFKAAAALTTLGAVAAAAWIAYACLIPVARFAPPKVVSVNQGDSLGVVARRLASAGVVRSAPAGAARASAKTAVARPMPR